MAKLSITLDLTKIDKTRIVERKYQDRDGVEHTAKEYKVDLVELREPKFIKEGSWGRMLKTHFVVQAQTKEEREAKAPSVFIGDGFKFERPEDAGPAPLTKADVPFDDF